jgi:hypothetical protein
VCIGSGPSSWSRSNTRLERKTTCFVRWSIKVCGKTRTPERYGVGSRVEYNSGSRAPKESVPAGKEVNPSELAAELAKQEICNNTRESARSGQRRQYPRKLTCRAAARLSAMCQELTPRQSSRGDRIRAPSGRHMNKTSLLHLWPAIKARPGPAPGGTVVRASSECPQTMTQKLCIAPSSRITPQTYTSVYCILTGDAWEDERWE